MTREEAIEAAAEAALIELSRERDVDVSRAAGWLRKALAMPAEPVRGFAGRIFARFRDEPNRVWRVTELVEALGDPARRIQITTTLARYHTEGKLERVGHGRYRLAKDPAAAEESE